VKKITVCVANDGCRFDSERDCLAYEKFAVRVARVMKLFPPLPKGKGNCDFENGHGYIQHDAVVLKKVKDQLLDLIGEKMDHPWIKQTKERKNIHPSWVGRLVSDMGNKPLSDAWYRIGCIDKKNREWGQQFFANNPEKGEQRCLNS